MSSASQSDEDEDIASLIGAIVLVSQDVERYLKVTIPFFDLEDASLRAALKRHENLRKRTLGELTGKFAGSITSDSTAFAEHMAWLVESRNQVVHHFSETYGARLAAGNRREVLDSLATLLANLRTFRSVVEQLTLVVFEGLRDVTFKGSPEYEQMGALCASLRAQIAN